MLENGKVSVTQFTVLVLIFTIGSSILVAPSGLASGAKQDAWISAIIGVGIGLLFILLYNALGRLFPNKTLVEYSELLLGKWIGKLVSLSFVSYFFILASLLLREIGDFMTTQIMPETPIQWIHILFLVVVIMGTRLGLETIIRATEIFFPWVITLFFLLIVFVFPEMEFTRILPVMENGLKPVLQASFGFLGLPFLELVVFLMIFPYVNDPKKAGKAFFLGTFIGGLSLIILTIATILILGFDLTERNAYPSYILGKKVNIGIFLQRIEVIVAIIWFITIYFKLTVCFYASVLGVAQILKLNEYRFLVLPVGMILIILSLVSVPDITYFNEFVKEIWTPYSLTYGLFLPVLMLIVAKFKGNTSSKQ